MVDTYVSDAYAPRVCGFKSHLEHQNNILYSSLVKNKIICYNICRLFFRMAQEIERQFVVNTEHPDWQKIKA